MEPMAHPHRIAELVALRHELHARAEPSGGEIETSCVLQGYLDNHRPDRLLTEIGGAGLAAVFEGKDPGPTVTFRAELDAVPVEEDTVAEHRSSRPGESHACGHDGHMAIVAGLAARFGRRPPRSGRVVLLFQPSEETGAGAAAVLDDERFESIAPDWIFALHNLPGENFGEVQIKSGPFAFGSVGLILRLVGTTSHAAYPEQGKNPAPAVAELIQTINELSDSEGSGDGIAMLTVIHARLGKAAFGTTPGEAEVMTTLRSNREEILDVLRDVVVRSAQRIAGAHDLECEHFWTDRFPVTTNHREAVAMVEAVAEAQGIGVRRMVEAYRWSEDFGWFTKRFKGALFGLGAGRDMAALHSPGYDFPDDLIPIGIHLYEGLVEKLLG
jgi:amidohydrolase